MLSNSKLQSIILTSNPTQAEEFYKNVLGLKLISKLDGATIFGVGGGDLRVSQVTSTSPTEHTILGFSVTNVVNIIDQMTNKGILFERFDKFSQEENGVLTTPAGTRVAWFRDPDGNLLSVVQYRE